MVGQRQGQGLAQEQLLRQRLSPKQLAFGRMLEMSAPEFDDEVRRVLDENPALEEVEPADAYVSEQPTDDDGRFFTETAEQLQQADYRDADDMPVYDRLPRPGNMSEPWMLNNDPDDTASGYERLDQQLGLIEIPPLDRRIAQYIIGNIDSNGYLSRDPVAIADDIAIGAGLDVDRHDVERAMTYVRSLDPPGICALNLQDCLQLQLERLDRTRPEVADALEIVSRRFDLFSKRHFDKLMTLTGLDKERFDRAVRVITSLNPKPGSQLEGVGAEDRTRHIVPDFTVETTAEGLVNVSLAGRVPELAVERSFMLPVDSAPADAATAAFVKARRDEAEEFIDLIRRRATTLMAVMEAIVALQPEFFATFDRSRLRPMVLRDIGRLTGLDLSVISRATATKYMSTPQGVFQLKSLFSEGSGDDGSTSSHAIDQAIREIISGEDKSAPLSDAEIGARLETRGIKLARRTVAKYRERLGFPVGRLRRQ